MDKSWRVIFAFVGIFAAGLLSGVLLAPRIFHSVVERRAGPGGPGPNFQQAGPQLFVRLTNQLNLTPEQLEKIKPIEQRTTEALRRSRREAQHNTEVTLDGMHDEISAILTPAQRTQFDERIARGRERMKKFLQQEQEGRGGRKGEPGGFNRPRDGAPPK